MGARNQAAATFGGSVYVSFGLIALTFSTLFNNSTTLALDPFLRLWAGTLLALVFGFLLLVSGLFVGSEVEFRRIVGGGVGVLSSLLGAINALIILTTSVGLGGLGVNPQVGASGELLFLGTIVLLFVGFPLGMIGSFQVMQNGRSEDGQM